jgi:hypothetical protein
LSAIEALAQAARTAESARGEGGGFGFLLPEDSTSHTPKALACELTAPVRKDITIHMLTPVQPSGSMKTQL